jgi:hypothetical protein
MRGEGEGGVKMEVGGRGIVVAAVPFPGLVLLL